MGVKAAATGITLAALIAVTAAQAAPQQEAAQPAAPDMDAAALVEARQETMRHMEAVWLMLRDMIDREGLSDRKAAAEGAEILASLIADMQRQYPEGSFVPPTEALPEVRQDWDAFLRLAAEAEANAEALQEAVLAESQADALEALKALEANCSACHLRFSPGIRSDLRPLQEVR